MARAWYFNNGLLAALVTLACAAAAGCDDASDDAGDAGDAGADGSVAHGESGKGGTSGRGGRGGGPNDSTDAGDNPSSKDSGVAHDAGDAPRKDAGTDAGGGDGDDEDAGDDDEEEGDLPNYVFVTSIARAPGALGGLDGADDFCNERAAAGDLEGTFVAWLSTPSVDARDRLGSARGWVSPDGLPFADRVEDIIAGRIWYPPAVDELGDAVRDRGVITGTADDGTFADQNDYTACGNWTVSSSDLAASGDPNATTQMWSGNGATQCDSAIAHLFCFGIDAVSPIDEPAERGRLAFVSAASFLPNASTTPDQACQADADAANLAGTFKALLAHEGSSAASRFDLEGEPWVRPDGVRIVGVAADLATDGWLAPINVQADGTYIGNYAVWLGASGPGDSGSSSTCGDWADNSNALQSYTMAAATSWPFAFSMPYCDADYARLFCLEE